MSPEVVSESIRNLPKGKSCGPDKVVYELLQIVNDIVSIYLANLYTSMLRSGYIPDSMKKGEIITLHKGKKRKK